MVSWPMQSRGLNGAGHPALGGFAQHDGLAVKPAALVQQAAQFAAIVAVLLYGVFVVNARHQAFVGNEPENGS